MPRARGAHLVHKALFALTHRPGRSLFQAHTAAAERRESLALTAARWHRVAQIRCSLPWALALHVLSSLLQTQAESADALAALRLAKRCIDEGVERDPRGALATELLAIEESLAAAEWRSAMAGFKA